MVVGAVTSVQLVAAPPATLQAMELAVPFTISVNWYSFPPPAVPLRFTVKVDRVPPHVTPAFPFVVVVLGVV